MPDSVRGTKKTAYGGWGKDQGIREQDLAAGRFHHKTDWRKRYHPKRTSEDCKQTHF